MPGQLKTALICLSLLFALVLGPRAALEAQERGAVPDEASSPYKGDKISVDFQDPDLNSLLRNIGEVAGKKIVVSEGVDTSGKITLKLKLRDVPWDQVLDVVLAAKNLGFDESDETLTIYDLPTLRRIQADRKRLAAERAAQAQHPAPLERKIFTPKHAPIGHVAAKLGKLQSERGKMVAIGNDIYVEDKPEAIAAMSQALIKLDRLAPQVLIEARLVEADAAFRETLAAAWKSGPPEPGRAEARPAALAYDFLSRDKYKQLKTILDEVQGQGQTRTISAPRVLVPDNEEMALKQGLQTPYVSSRSAHTTCGPTFKEVVMELIARPHIEEDGQSLSLDLKIIGEPVNTSLPETYADIRKAVARLKLQDGQSLVIGGLVTEADQGPEGRPANGRSGSISDWLFKGHAAKNIEVLIFLTATIVPAEI